ncbi:MAG: hypothetical protein Q7S21_05390 [archaeon]|nr:hypothetical protein [archaeon]
MILQNDFNKMIGEFNQLESFRDDIWQRCEKLLRDGYNYEAYSLLLATWNFAYFRYMLTTMKSKDFENAINETQVLFKELEGKHFEKADFSNDINLRNKTEKIYETFKKIVKQTGASKIMALRMPELFVMWDTGIRKMWKINNKASSEDYLDFLVKMQKEFNKIKVTKSNTSLAKAIDEYNYIKSTEQKK